MYPRTNKAAFAAAVRTQFPFIDDKDSQDIARRATQHGDSVGHNLSLPLEERVRIAVVAYIRHTVTTYEDDLRYTARSEAQRRADRQVQEFLHSSTVRK